MKTTLILLFTSLVCVNINAQSTQHIISTGIGQCGSVYTADFNGDGHMDVLSACGDSIDWWENDGDENFTRHPISTDVDRPYQVYADDIDNDDVMHVFYTSREDDKLAWHENTDGAGNFGPQQLITAQANTDGSRFLDTADIDGDGLKDVISASSFDGKIAWYKNLGLGDFGDINTNQLIISTEEDGAISVHAAYINDDLFIDVVAASSLFPGNGKKEIVWFANNGDGTFGDRQMVEFEMNDYTSVSSGDFNGDNYVDLVSTSWEENRVAWHKNTDGEGTFETIILSEEAMEAVFVYAIDIDDDGDQDFLAALFSDHKIVAYINDGGGDFSERRITAPNVVTFPASVHAEDVDGDGIKDVLSASVGDNKIAWYNDLIIGIKENTLVGISIFPNPVKDVLSISAQNDNPISSIQIYDILGRMVLEEKDDFNQMDVSNLVSGVLFVKIRTNEEVATKKIIKE